MLLTKVGSMFPLVGNTQEVLESPCCLSDQAPTVLSCLNLNALMFANQISKSGTQQAATRPQNACLQLSLGQTSSESEPLMRSDASLGTLLARHPDWELRLTDLTFFVQEDGCAHMLSLGVKLGVGHC